MPKCTAPEQLTNCMLSSRWNDTFLSRRNESKPIWPVNHICKKRLRLRAWERNNFHWSKNLDPGHKYFNRLHMHNANLILPWSELVSLTDWASYTSAVVWILVVLKAIALTVASSCLRWWWTSKRKIASFMCHSVYLDWISFALNELRKHSALRLQGLFICSFQANTKNWEITHAQVMHAECSVQFLEHFGMRLYPGHVAVEIEHYSIAYFDHATAFEVLQCGTSFKGGVNMH